MSILIKDMKMPKNCAQCLLKASCIHRIYMDERPSDCPLIELPKHGRLIDGDALIVKVREELLSPQNKKGVLETMGAMFRAVLDAPTIIESEGEDG